VTGGDFLVKVKTRVNQIDYAVESLILSRKIFFAKKTKKNFFTKINFDVKSRRTKEQKNYL